MKQADSCRQQPRDAADAEARARRTNTRTSIAAGAGRPRPGNAHAVSAAFPAAAGRLGPYNVLVLTGTGGMAETERCRLSLSSEHTP
jgi:hypothetical protein